MNCLQLLFEKILWYNIPFAGIVKPFFLRKALFHPSCVFPYASGINVSAEAALTQVDQPVCFLLLDIRTCWPTRAELLGALPCKLVNLSERRFGAHIDATGVWRLIGYPNDLLFVKNGTLWFDMECLLRILRPIESGS